ncbi:MAG: hypothetical protein U9P70_05195 [Patescibacteria group bacterium]|nr:hypothetical protein [Patescibacteria group bacterium]
MKATTSDGTETSPTNKMLHFIVNVRWGNVIGDQEATQITAKTFDGSVSVSSSARVSLERTLLFERHNTDDSEVLACEVSESYVADKITKRKDPVSWNSLIYGHWDGVKVLVSSPASDLVTITTAEGNIEMSAEDLYNLSEPYIEDVGDGNEIVVNVYPIKDPKYFLKVLWGRTTRADYAIRSEEAGELEVSSIGTSSDVNAVIANSSFRKTIGNITWHNASGSFQINGGGKIKLVKPLRFERNDKIVLSNSSLNIFNARRLNWNKVLVVDNAQMKKFQLGETLKYPDGALVRTAGSVYVMDKGEKRWVRSGDDLTGAGYSEDDIIEVTDPTEIADLEVTTEGYDIVADDDDTV